MNNILKNILKDRSGGTTIMITVLIMTTILTVALSLGSVVINGLKASANQANATQAYFASEAAAENFLWEARKKTFDPASATPPCSNSGNQYIKSDFTGCQATESFTILDNNAKFFIKFATSSATTTEITNFGTYKDTRRAVLLGY